MYSLAINNKIQSRSSPSHLQSSYPQRDRISHYLTVLTSSIDSPGRDQQLSQMSSNSEAGPSDVLKPQYTPEEISDFNKQLDGKTPQEILVWAIDHLDGLFQTTAFGL